MSLDDKDRELILGIAREQKKLSERMDKYDAAGKPVSDNIDPDDLRDFLGVPQGRITSTIEHTTLDRKSRFKMDVQFRNADLMSQPDRMRKCEQFLVELADLLKDYGVIRLAGTYVGTPESIQA